MQDEYNGYKMFMVRGKPRFRKVGVRGIAKQNTLPRDVMEHFGLLNPDVPAEEDAPDEPRKDPKACIFCGVHSRFTRFVNLQTIYLCDNHYYDVNIGKCAQRLRELKEKEHATS